MDTRTGEIIPSELIEKMEKAEKKFHKPMTIEPTRQQMLRKPPRIAPNEPCPCASGKKFKKCCKGSVK